MKHKVTTQWKGKELFDSTVDGHTIRIDASSENLEGPSPKRLLLSGLAGCSGIDVVSTLKKMRVPIEGLEIDVEAGLSDDHPRVYNHIMMNFRFTGSNIAPKKVVKAIELSLEQYCGVAGMLRKSGPIEYTYEIIESD
jgi:putative redox protein